MGVRDMPVLLVRLLQLILVKTGVYYVCWYQHHAAIPYNGALFGKNVANLRFTNTDGFVVCLA